MQDNLTAFPLSFVSEAFWQLCLIPIRSIDEVLRPLKQMLPFSKMPTTKSFYSISLIFKVQSDYS